MDIQDYTMPNNTPNTDPKPTLLKVLCILTFIASGLGIFGSLITLLGLGNLMRMFGSYGELNSGIAITISLNAIFFAAAKGFGAWQMWQLKKIGFFIYAAAAIASLVISPLVLSMALGTGFQLSYAAVGLTAIFVGLYYTNLSAMK